MNMSPTNKAHFEAEKEAIHLILTGIGDEIYSTVDACQTAQEMWEAIEWLQQGESLNIQDAKTNYFGNLRTMNVARAMENVGSLLVQQSRIQCFNCKEFGHFAKECIKPKRVNDSAYHKEKMLLCKQAEKGVPLQAKQYDWLEDMDEEINEQELEAHYSYMAKIQEVPTADTCTNSEPLEQTQNDSFIFVHELKQEMHADLKYVESFKKEIDEVESDKAEFSNMYDMILQESVSNDVMCSYLLSLSDLDALAELQCLYLHKVKECDCLAQKLSKQTESVSKEVHTELLQHFAKVEKHSISLEIDLQKFYSDHFACVTQMLNDVNARTKKPNVVPINTRKPKGHANKSVATPHKKKVASKSTNHIPQSYFRMLYEKTSKTWKWWIEQQSPSGYKWVPKTKMQWVPKAKNENVQKRHMTDNLKLLCNFIKKSMGTVRFGNDQFAPIFGYRALVQGNIKINRVYYVKGLNHNLFSVGQFCDADLEKDVVIGLPKLKYVKDQLCSSCELSKAKRSSLRSKAVLSSKGRLNLLHMDLCGPMRVASINGKKYILVIVDDYSRYTWNLFLRFKDETPKVLKEFLTMIQRNLQAPVITVRTDRGTEFLNKTLNAFFKEERIEHQTSTTRTPEQNDVVERRNRTLVEAGRMMLSALKLPLFFWVEAIATACYTQNRSIIIPTHDKMAYHIINDRKPLIKHLHIFCCICYITRDGEHLDKMKEKGDLCILVGYSTQSKGYHVYNKRTRLIVESIHIRFDEIKEMSETSVANDTLGLVPQRQNASNYDNSTPVPQLHNVSSSADAHVPSQQELDLLFGPLYDEFFNACPNSKDTQPTTNILPTSAPSTPTYVHVEENNNNQAEEEHLPDDEFLSVHQHKKMLSLPHTTLEAMADSAWIEAMQEELHQFDRLQRLLASFKDDAKYEHVGQDKRLQGGKRRSRQKDKDLKISDEKTKSKDNDKS
uniref:Retrovirus-related Pol polyprotein from transposon TNT 1-94 n=1 Tax=Tanacetum cinerariifolium TaxID=118510 RepID=A0A6L2MCB1_TANCI|nr:hypothetical protein [Tanacetum cinerariifolium]